MHIEQVLERLRTFAARGAGFHLNEGAAVASIRAVEQQLQVELPEQVVQFWTAVNGLKVEEPPFQMFPLSQFSREAGLLFFGTCNREVPLAFDTREKNAAGQWSIINADTGYRITYTMASFWSTHLWAWLVKRRPIWLDAHTAPSESI